MSGGTLCVVSASGRRHFWSRSVDCRKSCKALPGCHLICIHCRVTFWTPLFRFVLAFIFVTGRHTTASVRFLLHGSRWRRLKAWHQESASHQERCVISVIVKSISIRVLHDFIWSTKSFHYGCLSYSLGSAVGVESPMSSKPDFGIDPSRTFPSVQLRSAQALLIVLSRGSIDVSTDLKATFLIRKYIGFLDINHCW